MTNLHPLTTYFFATQEASDLAQQILDLAARDYHCESSFRIRTDNRTLGEIARAMGMATTPPDHITPNWSLFLWVSDTITIRVMGPQMVAKTVFE